MEAKDKFVENDTTSGESLANWGIIGQISIVKQLSLALESDRLSHAYLFSGPRHVGKNTLARTLAASVNCQGNHVPCRKCNSCQRIMATLHSDFQLLQVNETAGQRGIGIQSILDFQHRAYLKPFEGKYHVLVIDEAEFLTEEASNALLKLLEEPPPNVLIILLVTKTSFLLSTVVSRCHVLEFQLVSPAEITGFLSQEYGLPISEATILANLSQGCIGWAIKAATDDNLLESKKRRLGNVASISGATLEQKFKFAANLADLMRTNRTEVREELELWSAWWREVLLIQLGVPEITFNLTQIAGCEAPNSQFATTDLIQILNAIKETEELLEANVNPVLALEELMLKIPVTSSA
ncbi:AAA family ATPase [SAR202 cluster bacterium AD-802-E10_MRT_200m]|nr:AAA family ATPase [SAR202 cluster bacterium AD-802-E10_MRT_200m]